MVNSCPYSPTCLQALLEEMRAEQRRQSELIELQASALQQFRSGAMHPAAPAYAEDLDEQNSFAEDEQGELTAVRSVLLPMDSAPVPRDGDRTNQSLAYGRGELIRSFAPAPRQDRRPEGGVSRVSKEEVGAVARRDAGRQAGGRKSNQQAAFGSSTVTGRHRTRQS